MVSSPAQTTVPDNQTRQFLLQRNESFSGQTELRFGFRELKNVQKHNPRNSPMTFEGGQNFGIEKRDLNPRLGVRKRVVESFDKENHPAKGVSAL
jgi:hypothetical protein